MAEIESPANPEVKEPKYSSLTMMKSKLDGLGNYEFDDEITLMVNGRVCRIGETYDEKDIEYTIQPISIKIMHQGKHKQMMEMDIDKDKYNKLFKKEK